MAPSLRTNPRKTAKAASSEAMNEAMEEEIRKRTMESPPEEKNAGGTKRHKTARGISGEVKSSTSGFVRHVCPTFSLLLSVLSVGGGNHAGKGRTKASQDGRSFGGARRRRNRGV